MPTVRVVSSSVPRLLMKPADDHALQVPLPAGQNSRVGFEGLAASSRTSGGSPACLRHPRGVYAGFVRPPRATLPVALMDRELRDQESTEARAEPGARRLSTARVQEPDAPQRGRGSPRGCRLGRRRSRGDRAPLTRRRPSTTSRATTRSPATIAGTRASGSTTASALRCLRRSTTWTGWSTTSSQTMNRW